MTTEPIPSLAEAMAEIRRLRARIEAMEAEVAIARGTLAKPIEDEKAAAVETIKRIVRNGPDGFTCNVPPSAPPHDE